MTWVTAGNLGSTIAYASKLRGFLTFNAKLNNLYSYQQFIAYAQHYHLKTAINTSASIGFSSSGISGSFSISPRDSYTQESHPMEVRAYNIYKK